MTFLSVDLEYEHYATHGQIRWNRDSCRYASAIHVTTKANYSALTAGSSKYAEIANIDSLMERALQTEGTWYPGFIRCSPEEGEGMAACRDKQDDPMRVRAEADRTPVVDKWLF